jgi:hypothetical protein
MTQKDGFAHAQAIDVDNDGEAEIVLRNQNLYVVITARWGGRVVAMYGVSGERGTMLVGNPCDDWNWMEQLNRYMDVPRNHPGCFADVGLEHEEYKAEVVLADGECVQVRLTSECGLVKEFELLAASPAMRVRYTMPESMTGIETEFALSPDYMRLLRSGSDCLSTFERRNVRGCKTGEVSVWVKPETRRVDWRTPYHESCGHACMIRAGSEARSFWIELGVSVEPAARTPQGRRRASKAPALV